MVPFKTNLNFQMRLSQADLALVIVLSIILILGFFGMLFYFMDRCDKYAARISARVAGTLERPMALGYMVHPVHDDAIVPPVRNPDEFSIV